LHRLHVGAIRLSLSLPCDARALQLITATAITGGHHIVNCINFGIGLFNYFVSMLPPTTKWIVRARSLMPT